MNKKLISILLICIIFLTSCGNGNLKAERKNLETEISELEEDIHTLQSEKNNLENLIRDLREENDIPRYIKRIEY